MGRPGYTCIAYGFCARHHLPSTGYQVQGLLKLRPRETWEELEKRQPCVLYSGEVADGGITVELGLCGEPR